MFEEFLEKAVGALDLVRMISMFPQLRSDPNFGHAQTSDACLRCLISRKLLIYHEIVVYSLNTAVLENRLN
jgi:hypothetical protein